MKNSLAVKPIQLMIVGAQKAGTSSLLKYLAQHPEIHTHKRVSEFVYFVKEEQYREGYENTFLRYFGDCPNEEVVVLAKSAMVMYSAEALQRLYQHNPQMYLVVSLRHPVNRAYSAYWFARRTGWEKLPTFEDALAAEAKRLEEGWLKWHDCCYVYNSLYYPHVKQLFNQFGRDRVTIIFAEELKNKTQEICQKIFTKVNLNHELAIETDKKYNEVGMPRSEFVARIFHQVAFSKNNFVNRIRKLVPQSLKNQTKAMLQNWNSKPFTPPPINPETKKELLDRFRESNQKLSELLAVDLSPWDD